MMYISKRWAMPSGNTFSIKPIQDVVLREVKKGGVIIDPFANTCKYATITNDLNGEYDTDYHMDALDFLRGIETKSVDLVLYDPPYSARQASELYKRFGKEKLSGSVTNMRYWSECKNEIARVLKPLGRVICCGWNTNGIGIKRGFIMTEILIISHGGSRNDTLVTVEYKKQ